MRRNPTNINPIPIMAKASFVVEYDGPAMMTGEMSVRDLAPSLMALNDLFDSVNQKANGDSARLALHLKATHRGSFGAELVAMLDAAVSFFTSDGVDALANIMQILGLSGGVPGLLQMLLQFGPRKIVAAEPVGDALFSMTDETGRTMIVHEAAIALFQDPETRAHAYEIVKPLLTPGIDSLTFKKVRIEDGPTDNDTEIRIDKEDVPQFVPPKAGETLLIEYENIRVVRIVSLFFKEGNHWKVSDGEATYSVRITDETFLKHVDAGRAFGKNDLLKVRMKTTQYRAVAGALRNVHEITQVIEHIPGAGQIDIFDPLPDDPTPPVEG